MALKHCTMAEMVSLSGPWCQPGHRERTALSRVPAIAALLPELDSAHASLLKSYWASIDSQKAATELSKRQQDLDHDHDSIIRAVHFMVQGYIHLNLASGGDPKLVEAYTELYDRLYPMGLQIVQASYREEAGQGALLAARLTAADKALLARIPMIGGSLLDHVLTWIRKAAELGELEDLRDSAGASTEPGKVNARTARNRWIRTVNAVLGLLELVSTDDAELLAIIGRVQEVARQAELRAGGTVPPDAVEPDDELDTIQPTP